MVHIVIAPGVEPTITATCGGNGRSVTTDSASNVLTLQQLDLVDVGVTTARIAVAPTGQP